MPLPQKAFGGLRINVDSFALDVLACELSMSMSLDMAGIFYLLLLLFVIRVFFPSLCSLRPNVQPAGQPALRGPYTLLILGEACVCTKVLSRPDNDV